MTFNLGDSIYLKTDQNQEEGIIVARRELIGGTVQFTCGWNGHYIDLYAQELTKERDELKVLGVNRQEHEH
tara:strand:+ start:2879 stop:3091 length:213 start_codon:yes stop_codon:yes gene_type:complete